VIPTLRPDQVSAMELESEVLRKGWAMAVNWCMLGTARRYDVVQSVQ